MRIAVISLFGLVAVTGLLVLPGSTHQVSANGVPQLVKLEYLPGVSNWGPQDAEGLLEFSFAEGYAVVDVKGLPPAEGATYEGWMRNAAGDLLLVGAFTTDASGIGHLDATLTGLERFDYNQFVVAARTDADAEVSLPTNLSIAGNFTVIGDDPASQPGGEGRPQLLPDTGELAADGGPGRAFVAMMAMAATGVTIVLVSQYRKRRRTS